MADRKQRGMGGGVAKHLVGPLDVTLVASACDDRVHVATHRLALEALLEQVAQAHSIPLGQEGIEPVLAPELVEPIAGQPLEERVGILDRALGVEQEDQDRSGLQNLRAKLTPTDIHGYLSPGQ